MSKDFLTVLIGSRAHGLARPDSDYDYRGVFLASSRDIVSASLLGSGKLKETRHGELSEDHLSYELGHFLRYAIKGNPAMIEVFGGPVVESSPLGEELLSLFPKVWNKDNVHTAYKGYAKNQLRKFVDDMEGPRANKYALAALRNLDVAIHLLRTGEVNLDVKATTTGDKTLYEAVLNNSIRPDEVIFEVQDRLTEFDLVYTDTSEHPSDVDYLVTWLERIRRV